MATATQYREFLLDKIIELEALKKLLLRKQYKLVDQLIEIVPNEPYEEVFDIDRVLSGLPETKPAREFGGEQYGLSRQEF